MKNKLIKLYFLAKIFLNPNHIYSNREIKLSKLVKNCWYCEAIANLKKETSLPELRVLYSIYKER